MIKCIHVRSFLVIRVMATIREELEKLAHHLLIGTEIKILKAHLDFFTFSARTGFSCSIASSDSPAATSLSWLFVLWRTCEAASKLLPLVLGRNRLFCFVTRSALTSAFPSFSDFSRFLDPPIQCHRLTICFYRTRVRSLAMLVSNWLTDWLTHSCLVNLIDVTLACEDAYSKLVEVVTVARVDNEKRVDNSLVQTWKVIWS